VYIEYPRSVHRIILILQDVFFVFFNYQIFTRTVA